MRLQKIGGAPHALFRSNTNPVCHSANNKHAIACSTPCRTITPPCCVCSTFRLVIAGENSPYISQVSIPGKEPALRMLRTVLKIMAATLAFSLIHSFFASTKVKKTVARAVGERHYNGLYRPFYMLQSVVTLGALIMYICSLPNKVFYKATGKLMRLMRLGQVLSILAQLHTAFQIGVLRMTGLRGLGAWLRGESKELGLEAQGPSLRDDGRLRIAGLFRYTRHPLNFLALPFLWLQTPMTTRWASFSAIASLYFYFGSFLEAAHLRSRYGRLYEKYERSGISFFLPRPLQPPAPAPSDGDTA